MERSQAKAIFFLLLFAMAIVPELPNKFTQAFFTSVGLLGLLQHRLFIQYLNSLPFHQQTIRGQILKAVSTLLQLATLYILAGITAVGWLGKPWVEELLAQHPLATCLVLSRMVDLQIMIHYCLLALTLDNLCQVLATPTYLAMNHDKVATAFKASLVFLALMNIFLLVVTETQCNPMSMQFFANFFGLNLGFSNLKDSRTYDTLILIFTCNSTLYLLSVLCYQLTISKLRLPRPNLSQFLQCRARTANTLGDQLEMAELSPRPDPIILVAPAPSGAPLVIDQPKPSNDYSQLSIDEGSSMRGTPAQPPAGSSITRDGNL